MSWIRVVVLGGLAAWSAVAGSSDAVAHEADAPAEQMPRSSLPLIGWWGPPPTDYHLTIYGQALLTWTPMTLPDATVSALDRALAQRLRVMLVMPGEDAFDLERIPNAVRAHEAVVACLVYEGVTEDTAAEAAQRAVALGEFAPEWTPVATVAPTLDDPAWEAAAMTLAAAGIPVLPMVLPFLADGTTDEASLYAALRGAASAAQRTGVPLWGMVQVTEHEDRRRASESDMRLQAYASLAHGARGLAYFTYWGPPVGHVAADDPLASYGLAMVDVTRGLPSYGHQMARIINAEITLMSPYLETLTPQGVYFVGDIPRGGQALRQGVGPISRIDSAGALVGFFEGDDGNAWAMVVNRQHGIMRSARTQGRTMAIYFEDAFSAIHVFERQTAFEIPVPVDTGSFTITLPGGTGSLIRFDRGSDGTE